jgi:MYXO-CTERM domain-containing protein
VRTLIAMVLLAAAAAPAAAGPASFRLSEVATASATGDRAARYIELESTDAACVFPTTEVVVYDAAGVSMGRSAPFNTATCFPAGHFVLLATPAAQAAFMTGADSGLVPALPGSAGQLCLVSSATRYDCVRWGNVTVPVHDLFGPTDDTHALAPPAGLALARIADDDVVATDWRVQSPTPRGPNDGTPWDPGDAGVDAPPMIDAMVDARPPRPDGGSGGIDAAQPDATSQSFLDLDPAGGAACGCRTGASPAASLPFVALALLVLRRRRRLRQR